jgi:hypothetical protein
MMIDGNVQERYELAIEELESPQSVVELRHEPNGQPRKDEVTARALLREESPTIKLRGLESEQLLTKDKEARDGLLKRRPLVYATELSFSPLPWAAAIFTWTMQDTSRPRTMP